MFHKTYHQNQLVRASLHAVLENISYTDLHFLHFLHHKQVACAGLLSIWDDFHITHYFDVLSLVQDLINLTLIFTILIGY